MRQLIGLFYWIMKVLFVALLAHPAVAKSVQKKPVNAKSNKTVSRSAQLSNSVKDAKDRAEKEQKMIRVKLDFEADERNRQWLKAQEDDDVAKTSSTQIAATQTKRPLKKSSIERLRFEKADFALEDSGEDSSGLDDIRSSADDEDIKIDFDSELREVSSLKP